MKSFFLFLLLIPILAVGQINVSGLTKSKTENIYFSHIIFKHIDGTSYSSISNEKSEYKVTVKPGLYKITTSYMGYSNFLKEIPSLFNLFISKTISFVILPLFESTPVL